MAIEIRTDERVDVVDVTAEVQEALPADAGDGVCTVFVPHTTAGVVVNENESGLLTDLETALEQLVARGGRWDHDAVDDNADAHLRSMLLGESVSVPVEDGSLSLGTWQSVLFVECDGPRRRTVSVTLASSE